MSWYLPLGRMRLIEIGNALCSISATARPIELFASTGTLIIGGAPRDNCNDRDPVILALSNLVSQGGPMSTLLPCAGISFKSYSISAYVTTSSTGLEDFFVVSSTTSCALVAFFDFEAVFLADFSEGFFWIMCFFVECFTKNSLKA